MAFAIKYKLQFEDEESNTHVVDLLEDGFSGTITELNGSGEPFSVNYPKTSKISFKRGSGCDINLLSETDRQLLDLYTIDMFGLQIRHYINSSLNWCGYLNSELYNEPYQEKSNYYVSVSGNDGLGLLKRMYYLTSGGAKYTGIVTQWTILQNIINKLNLPYTYINVGIGTTFSTGYDSSASENIFSNTYISNANFYNEDGDAESLDTVLKGILEPYGAFMFQSDGELWIMDMQTMYNSTLTYKRYNSSFTYLSTPSVSNSFNISSIGYADVNGNLAMESGINKQIISYSPYARFNTTEYKTNSSDEIASYGSWTSSDGWYKQSVTPLNWSVPNNGNMRGSKSDESGKPEYYIYWTNDNNPVDKWDDSNQQVVATYNGSTPYVIGVDNKSLSIKFQSFVRTATNPYEPEDGTKVEAVQLKAKIQVGSYYYDGVSNSWVTDSSKYEFINLGDYTDVWNGEDQSNRWLDIRWGALTIPLEAGIEGDLRLSFLSNFTTFENISNTNWDYLGVEDIWVKDVTIDIVDEGNTLLKDDDIEYIGYLNSLYENSGSDIKTICGTNTENNPVALGSLLRDSAGDKYFITSWSRNSKTGTIEELLLNTVVSNYSGSTLNLNVTVKNTVNPHNIITDSTYLSGKTFLITEYKNNFRSNTVSLGLSEFYQDYLTFNRI